MTQNKFFFSDLKFFLLFCWVMYGSHKRSELEKNFERLNTKEAEIWLRVNKIEDSLITKKIVNFHRDSTQ